MSFGSPKFLSLYSQYTRVQQTIADRTVTPLSQGPHLCCKRKWWLYGYTRPTYRDTELPQEQMLARLSPSSVSIGRLYLAPPVSLILICTCIHLDWYTLLTLGWVLNFIILYSFCILVCNINYLGVFTVSKSCSTWTRSCSLGVSILHTSVHCHTTVGTNHHLYINYRNSYK